VRSDPFVRTLASLIEDRPDCDDIRLHVLGIRKFLERVTPWAYLGDRERVPCCGAVVHPAFDGRTCTTRPVVNHARGCVVGHG
jgi:hypothetical protein